MIAAMLAVAIQTTSMAVDDVWGGMGLSEDAVQQNKNYADTVFDKYTNYSDSSAPKVNNGQYPTDFSGSQISADSSDKENRKIKTKYRQQRYFRVDLQISARANNKKIK